MYESSRIKADRSDSSEIIDHSSGDVAYLRIAAHSEERAATNAALNLVAPPILEDHFQDVYDRISILTPVQPEAGDNDAVDDAIVCIPKLVQIGDGLYATDSIAPSSAFSIEQDTRSCLDTLNCTSL
jgi:hypothetical protein